MVSVNKDTRKDSWVRSWTKSFTWRVLGIVILLVLTYLITKSWAEASLITVVFHAIRVVLYVLHERAWEFTAWGRAANPGITMFWFYFWLLILIFAFAAIVLVGSV